MVVISSISGLACGDDWVIRRPVALRDDLAGQRMVKASLFIKRDLFAYDSEAFVVVTIGTANSPGVGQIEVDGGPDALLRFEVGREQTGDKGMFRPVTLRGYSVHVVTERGLERAVEKGMLLVW